jgi:ABC-2 type transport system ATP-binding protein
MSGVERQESPGARCPPLLEVQGLSKHFGSRRALAGLSLSVRAGEIVGLVGSNGSGKTTSLRILAGLLKADSGRGAIAGIDLDNSAELRVHVGYLSQRDSLYGTLTVQENLSFRAEAFGLHNPTELISAAIDRYELRPFATQPVEQLSGGWARILQLAVALLHEPQVVMLDEPTAGLDVIARQVVWRHLTRLAGEGRAILLSTHDLLDASRCSRVVLLSQGHVRANGRPEDLVCAAGTTVLAIIGARVLTFVESLQSIEGVITSYPSGSTVRALVTPGAQQQLTAFAEAHDLIVERVDPTLEDAFLELSQREFAVVRE